MNFTEKTEEHTPLIEVIGYQFERVHTGVIKWLLDSEYQDVPMEEKRKIIERIYEKSHQSSPFASDQVEEIICHPEYAFARTRRIDLVVEIKMADGNRKYIVMEMKVDTIPGGKQLQGTYNDFCCRHSDQKDDTLFLLLLFGTAQVFKIPDVPPFHVWKLSDIIDVFQGVEVSHPIYAEWMRVLEREQDRARHVEERLAGIGGKGKDKGWKRHGYRNRFSFFYYLYDQLRKYSRHGAEQWKIHGSPHNPLMNFTWMPTTLFGKPVHVYFEFNYEHLFFKLADQEQKLTRDELTLCSVPVTPRYMSRFVETEGHRLALCFCLKNSFPSRNLVHFVEKVCKICKIFGGEVNVWLGECMAVDHDRLFKELITTFFV